MHQNTSSIMVLFMTCILACGCSEQQSVQASSDRQVETPSPSAIEGAMRTIPKPARQPNEYTDFVPPKRKARELTLIAKAAPSAPRVDGDGNDKIWNNAVPIETLDFASQRSIRLSALHHNKRLYMRIQFPDEAPSERHKSWVWDDGEECYRMGTDREDAFCLKWSMVGNDINLAVRGGEPHFADVWFWKANRTNPAGYFDDKHHIVSKTKTEGSIAASTDNNDIIYLARHGDKGESAYESKIALDYMGTVVPKYHSRKPSGSRADILGRGVWRDGIWTIELSRALNTGHDDDVSFKVGGSYLFAACCYEMAHTGIVKSWTQPLYRSGRVFDRLTLRIE